MEITTLQPDEKIPDNWVSDYKFKYFVQGGNLFKLINTPLFSYITSVDRDNANEILSTLEYKTEYEANMVYLQKSYLDDVCLPEEELAFTMRFFRETFNKYGSECAVLLLLNKETMRLKVLPVLMKDVSQAGVTYIYPNSYRDDITEIPKSHRQKALDILEEYDEYLANNYILCGTIHSHSNFGAFHSGIDDDDEMNFDGIHITIGNVDANYSYSSRLMIGGTEWKFELQELLKSNKSLEDIANYANSMEFNSEIVDKLVIPRPKPKPISLFSSTKVNKGNHWYNLNSLYKPSYNFNATSENNDYDIFDDLLAVDYNDNVFDEDEMIIIFNTDKDEIKIVKRDFYYEHRHSLFNDYTVASAFDVDELRVREIEIHGTF